MAENNDQYFVGIKFRGSDKSYYFSTQFGDLKRGDLVVVHTVSGYELGTVCTAVMNRAVYQSDLELKPIERKPTLRDLEDQKANLAEEKKALSIVQREVEALALPMDLIEAIYSLDGSRVTIIYTSPEKRVDFRELLNNLRRYFSCRIELRQIASRDKAKLIGGLGICGLPLCCSTFLNEIEGIGINLAKNQMLTLNIPKLSGACGKLICCLKYEDEAYTQEKKLFPRPGTIVHTPEGDYAVDSFNILSRNIRLVNSSRDDWKTYSLDDVNAMLRGNYKKKEEPLAKPEEYHLPSFDIPGTSQGSQPNRDERRQDQQQQQRREERNRHFHGHNRHHGHGNNQGNGGQRDNAPRNDGQGQQNNGGHKNRNRHHHHNRHGGEEKK